MLRPLVSLSFILAAACSASHAPGDGPAPSSATCTDLGGRCQSPDLPCDPDTEWAGYDRCGDIGNNSCCVPSPVAPLPPAPTVVLSLLDSDFAFCRCHHGFGPGADGMLTLRVRNERSTAVEVWGRSLSLVALSGGNVVSTDDGTGGWLRFDRLLADLGPARVAAGVERDIAVAAYLDCAEENLVPGWYRVEMAAEIDGHVTRIVSDPREVTVVP